MFFSSNNTFHKSKKELLKLKKDMNILLSLKNRSSEDIDLYNEAFTFFTFNPNSFDGATIVKDLNDLPNIDLDAMVHDYEYISGANLNFIKKWKSDLKYMKNMELQGKGVRIFRLLLLTIIGIFFVPYCKIKNKCQ